MVIKSTVKKITKTKDQILLDLSNINYLATIIPTEKAQILETTNNSIQLLLNNTLQVRLVKTPETLENCVRYENKGNMPFDLEFIINENINSEIQTIFTGQINTMMAMMLKQPLTNFINQLNNNIY